MHRGWRVLLAYGVMLGIHLCQRGVVRGVCACMYVPVCVHIYVCTHMGEVAGSLLEQLLSTCLSGPFLSHFGYN